MVQIESLADLDGTPHASVFPTAEPKTIRLTLGEGERIAPHRHPTREIVLYLLSGQIDLQLDDSMHRITAGDVVHFDGDRNIAPVANEESVALLVLATRTDEQPSDDSA